MPEAFVPLERWLRPPVPPETGDAAAEQPPVPAEPANEERLYSALRRLRAAVLEALDAPDAGALERIRMHADALLGDAP